MANVGTADVTSMVALRNSVSLLQASGVCDASGVGRFASILSPHDFSLAAGVLRLGNVCVYQT